MPLLIRNAEPKDHAYVISRIDAWWGGRHMADMLPTLFFIHFRATSFVAEVDGRIAGFLCGFLSQTFAHQAYIHFVGVDPTHRKERVGRTLYEHFFIAAAEGGRSEVRAVTSPVNHASLAFHRALGFEPLPGDTLLDGVPCTKHYDGEGESRVLLAKLLP